ncbi:molybdopterin molybdotransferase MoeA [Pedobacter sp. SAFR-022]|uniref:molybdopterin molybdotransferase MoeA n=1 Tax=Pedobacter sp. SAFR-022 TaxID=3436861 RepID=UPI003F7D97D2
MISVNEAKDIITESVKRLPSQRLPLGRVLGLVLGEDVYALTDIPNFRQSSMDGYAIRFEPGRTVFTLAGEMAAGSTAALDIDPAEAVRIFTGAPLPAGADTVVMQEKVSLEAGRVMVEDGGMQAFQHVREKGAEIKRGALAMQAGTLLSPAAIGFLAGIGIPELQVIPAPKVSIILTGNELQEPGKPLAFGQVYEANSVMLSAALRQLGVEDVSVLRAVDDLKVLQDVLSQALLEADLVLLTGGVSVGDYDFVVAAAKNCGVKQAFHKIRQKPGKPLFFGSKYQKIVFGLPGNPSSVLSCFYQYVLPAVGRMMDKNLRLQVTKGILTHDYAKVSGLTHFLKASFNNGNVTPLHAQESFRLHSFAEADCLIVLDEAKGNYQAGEQVEVHLLPRL